MLSSKQKLSGWLLISAPLSQQTCASVDGRVCVSVWRTMLVCLSPINFLSIGSEWAVPTHEPNKRSNPQVARALTYLVVLARP